MFYIGFVAAPRPDAQGRRRAAGDITLGDDSRPFDADLDHWSAADYETSWRDAVLRLAAGPTSSALVTSYHGPDAGGHEVWPMRREGTTVFIGGPVVVDRIDEAVARVAGAEWRFSLGQLLAFAVEE